MSWQTRQQDMLARKVAEDPAKVAAHAAELEGRAAMTRAENPKFSDALDRYARQLRAALQAAEAAR